MSCIKVIVRNVDAKLCIRTSLVCSIKKPTLNYLMDSIGQKLYDISGKLLIAKK